MFSCSQPLPGYSKYVMVKRAAPQIFSDFQDRGCLLLLYLQRTQQCKTQPGLGKFWLFKSNNE